jgi:2-oxoglutarate ferredoxin oxidoreductase subunit alpha
MRPLKIVYLKPKNIEVGDCMAIDITIKIGGEAGQGIQSVGELLSKICCRAGLFVFGINDFESRIRGGVSFSQIRISDCPVSSPCHQVDLLVAFNETICHLFKHELAQDGLIIIEEDSISGAENILNIPFKRLAGKAGDLKTLNTVAVCACMALLGAPFKIVNDVINKQFAAKGEQALEKNVSAAAIGYESVKNKTFKGAFSWEFGNSKGVLIDGSKAIALGALAADCRFASFYPMSPATGIMNHLAAFSEKIPLIVEQAEDEISAVNMIIGASFAGVRSMTSTSGGGFCLMTEGLGLAGITETPIVIVNAQRPGPATGLPTRTAQSDLLFVINASQDEFPRFVFAPGSPNEAFDITLKAFELSEKYQVPAIILSDQYLSDSIFLTTDPFLPPKQINRFVFTDKNVEPYNRYAITDTGISPRALPCMGDALVSVSGNEHREDGHISEKISNRIHMVNKRNSKLPDMLCHMRLPSVINEDSDLFLIGWGSTKYAIKEAVEMLQKEGISVGCMHFTDMWPFPADEVSNMISKKKIIVVELNSSAQLGRLIREQTGRKYDKAILKYDGRPMYPYEIAEQVKTFVEENHG